VDVRQYRWETEIPRLPAAGESSGLLEKIGLGDVESWQDWMVNRYTYRKGSAGQQVDFPLVFRIFTLKDLTHILLAKLGNSAAHS